MYGQLVDVFDAARSLESQRLEAGRDGGGEFRLSACARAITSCGSCMSLGLIRFTTSAAL
jgi:hypothetical protein